MIPASSNAFAKLSNVVKKGNFLIIAFASLLAAAFNVGYPFESVCCINVDAVAF